MSVTHAQTGYVLLAHYCQNHTNVSSVCCIRWSRASKVMEISWGSFNIYNPDQPEWYITNISCYFCVSWCVNKLLARKGYYDKKEDFMASYPWILNHKWTSWVVMLVVIEGCVDRCYPHSSIHKAVIDCQVVRKLCYGQGSKLFLQNQCQLGLNTQTHH